MSLKFFAALSTVVLLADLTAVDAQAYRTVTHGPVSVNCGADRHAVVSYSWNEGRRSEHITCASSVRRVHAVHHAAPHRSWKKSALVIGGATAAGAGAGALIGGGKGALIGGAAGAGAGTLYEIHKRHKHHRHY